VAKEVTTDAPTDDEELTPAEEKKFGKFLNKFLEEDDASDTTPRTPTPTPVSTAPSGSGSSSSSVNIADEINKALDAREGRAKSSEEVAKLRIDVDALKPKPKSKWSPWTLFSGVL
jgi:hypothetical protein